MVSPSVVLQIKRNRNGAILFIWSKWVEHICFSEKCKLNTFFTLGQIELVHKCLAFTHIAVMFYAYRGYLIDLRCLYN